MESLLKVGGKMKSAEVVYKPNPSPGGANLFIYHLPQVQTSHQPSQSNLILGVLRLRPQPNIPAIWYHRLRQSLC